MYLVSAHLCKVNSVQEACTKCFAVHILKFEILQTTWKNKTKKHQNARFIGEKLKTKSPMFLVLIFFMIFKISNFNMWTRKHFEQASCTELTLAQLDEKMTSPMLKDSISLRVYSRASNISVGLNKCVGWNFFEI